MKNILLLLLCLPMIVFAQTTTSETMMHDGETRSYFLHLPPQYDGSTKLPVVFVLHGLGDSANNMQNTGFKELGNQEGFISVYPQGLESPLGSAWNNGSNISLFGFAPDDIGFLSNLVDDLIQNYSADNTRIYSCGFSMGGIMSHYLGCNLSDKIAAIASQGGTMATATSSSCSPSRAVPAMHIHGDADETVNYDGDAGLYGLNSAPATIAKWAEINGCSETPAVSSLPDSAADGFTITKTDYTPCAEDSDAILLTVHGAGHIWLGPNNDIFTTEEFWYFFADHVNNLSSPVGDLAEINFVIYPNPVEDILVISGLDTEMDIRITDISGKQVLSGNSNDNINVAPLAKGAYFIQVLDPKTGASSSEKFIKL
ncbi:MAG: polyhydroxybutyrate depolymerase [Maribacter sp.]|jgi:polyhydroxybutyrate depolymerase